MYSDLCLTMITNATSNPMLRTKNMAANTDATITAVMLSLVPLLMLCTVLLTPCAVAEVFIPQGDVSKLILYSTLQANPEK